MSLESGHMQPHFQQLAKLQNKKIFRVHALNVDLIFSALKIITVCYQTWKACYQTRKALSIAFYSENYGH